MGFDKIEAVSLTDQFVQKIESMIISGELMPGDQLPPARELLPVPVPLLAQQELLPVQHLRLRLLLRLLHMLFH